MAQIKDLPMKLYYVELITKEGNVEGDHFEIAESPELCVEAFSSGSWKDIYARIHSIEYMCDFESYEGCLRRLEICINYSFAQIEQLAIVSGHFADSVIRGKPEEAEVDQGHACTVSFVADQIGDRLEEAKRYINAIEHLTWKQRGAAKKIGTEQNVAQ